MRHFILDNKTKYFKKPYKLEQELTKVFEINYKEIISEKSFFIPAGKQFKTKNFKNSICDGFMLVWENPSTPLLYITEIELENHSVEKHILPQIGDFFSFIRRSSAEDLSLLRNFIYDKVKKDPELFKKIQKDTDREVYELIDSSLEDLQVLLIIDRMSPDLSLGLRQIEKAINLKIRKIEVSRFESSDKNEVIYYSDSETENIKPCEPNLEEDITTDEYTLDYHIKEKPENIKAIVNHFIEKTKKKFVIQPQKHYIGFFKNDKMVLSIVVRNKNVIFYSKALINSITTKYDKLNFRDVRNIGHLTNHLPTEIVISELGSVDQLIKYVEELNEK